MMLRIIPKVFYTRIEDGLDLFVNCLKFKVLHQDQTLTVVEREGVKVYLVEDAEFAAKDRPELTIETDAIESLYSEISASRSEVVHPNANVVERKPWGSREFAVRDQTQVCVIFRQC